MKTLSSFLTILLVIFLLAGCGNSSNDSSSYSITGTVTSGGTPLPGVTMTLSGAGTGSATTSAGGNYTLSGLANGSYTITPAKTNCTFTPASSTFNLNGASITGANFSATVSYGISVAVTGQGGAGWPMTLYSGGIPIATGTAGGSFINGAYTFSGLANGNYVVVPTVLHRNIGGSNSLTTAYINPTSLNVTINGADATASFSTSVVY